MNKYVVAYLSLHDGTLKQEIVEANSQLEAALSYLGWDDEGLKDMDSLREQLENMDAFISVLQISVGTSKRFTHGPARPHPYNERF